MRFARKKAGKGDDMEIEGASRSSPPSGHADFADGQSPKIVKYTLAIKGDEPRLLRVLVDNLASKEGFTVKYENVLKRSDYRLQMGASAGKPYVLFECSRTTDDHYLLYIRRLGDGQQAHRLMALLMDFVPKWYQELRRSFFH